MALEKELATYAERLDELKQHEGKYVLIHESEVVEVFTSYEDAVKAGYARFQLSPFLVRQIQAVEQAQFITRFVATAASLASA